MLGGQGSGALVCNWTASRMDAGPAVVAGLGSPTFETDDVCYAWLHILQAVAAGASGTSTIETLSGHRRGDGPPWCCTPKNVPSASVYGHLPVDANFMRTTTRP